MELFAALERACESTGRIVAETSPVDYPRPTPCTAWDVHDLLNHVIGTLWFAEALFSDRSPAFRIRVGDLPDVDLVGEDPGKAFGGGAEALLAVTSVDGAFDTPRATPFGDMPGPALAGFTTLDIAVHGWDLARATGQPIELDVDLAAHLLGFAGQAIGPAQRGTLIGPELDPPPDASPTERLVAFLGRRP